MKIPELLAPAGNPEKLATAFLYGADAAYLGGKAHNLRASCDGFDEEELRQAVKLARSLGRSVYYCLNSLPMQSDIQTVPEAIETAARAGVHAFIIADAGIFRLARKYAPHIPIHISTQMNSTNSESLAFWQDMGANRANLARELSCRDTYAIRRAIPGMETEVFSHGAMCLAVSGQCLLSAWLNKRPANLGQCTHPCRFEYRALSFASHDAIIGTASEGASPELIVDEKIREGNPLWRVKCGGHDSEQEAYASFWAPEDLCLMPYVPWLVQTGVSSMKIEGRMKGPAYVAHVVDAYRSALDACAANSRAFDWKSYMPELFATASRPLGTGFFVPGKRRNLTLELGAKVTGAKNGIAAKILEHISSDGSVLLADVRGQWRADADIVLMLPGLQRPVIKTGCYSLEKENGEQVNIAHPGTRIVLRSEQLSAYSASLQTGVFLRTG